jgi:hypothetical protein
MRSQGLALKGARKGWNPYSTKITSRTDGTLTGLGFLMDGFLPSWDWVGRRTLTARQADLTKTKSGEG